MARILAAFIFTTSGEVTFIASGFASFHLINLNITIIGFRDYLNAHQMSRVSAVRSPHRQIRRDTLFSACLFQP